MRLKWQDLQPGDKLFLNKFNFALRKSEIIEYEFLNWVTKYNKGADVNLLNVKDGTYLTKWVDDYIWEHCYKEYLDNMPKFNDYTVDSLTYAMGPFHKSNLPVGFGGAKLYGKFKDQEQFSCTCGAWKTYGRDLELAGHSYFCDLKTGVKS